VEESTLRRVTAVLGWKPTQAHPVRGGGYTPAERWLVSAGEGLSAFDKIGVTPFTAEALRAEARSYRLLQGDFLPALIGFDDRDERPLLVLESLDHGYWPPPWRPGDVERVLDMLARVAAVRPSSADLPSLEDMRAEFSSWTEVERDPIPFLSLGLCSRGWLARALPTLLRAGGNDYPMNLLRTAGVDLSQPDTVQAVVSQLDDLVTRLEAELGRGITSA
jgi:hypothetical protein